MFENPRRDGQARNFTTNAPKILYLKSPSEQIFSRKLPLGAPDHCSNFNHFSHDREILIQCALYPVHFVSNTEFSRTIFTV